VDGSRKRQGRPPPLPLSGGPLAQGAWRLPDGRTLTVMLSSLAGPDTADRQGTWELVIGSLDAPEETVVGSPLPSSLAAVLGYDSAHDRWPGWVDRLAGEIEDTLRERRRERIRSARHPRQ
jgi:hypothetical protein